MSKNDLTGIINEIALTFEDFALIREIRFTFKNPGEALDVWFDPVQMKKGQTNQGFCFKDHFGMSPNKYRKKQQGNNSD